MKTTKTNIILTTLLTLTLLTFTHCKKSDCIEYSKPKYGYTEQYETVFCCNGKAYGNPCIAESMGINNYTNGACK
jgi:hypothetical protein